MSKLTEIEELALDLGGTASIRLIITFSDKVERVTRNYILNHLSTSGNPDNITIDDLYVITIDRFEIFITNMGYYPFFNEFLPRIHNLIIDINSYELSGYELYNTSY
jgi:hypothetical protein